MKYSIMDYSKEKRKVNFQVGVKQVAMKRLMDLKYTDGLSETEEGFTLNLSYQEIPQIVRELANMNTSIYAIECE